MSKSSEARFSEPGSLGWCATMACVWEVTAPKPGNVYCGADFEDATYGDFIAAAVAIGPVINRAPELGWCQTLLAAVQATRAAVGTNTNLGTLLLIAPLAGVACETAWREAATILAQASTSADTAVVYEAIRSANPGGMGEVDEGDVSEAAPNTSLLEVMQLAADRDTVARQYTNGFAQVWEAADLIHAQYLSNTPLGEAIVLAFLQLMSRYPDTLIARKCGAVIAAESQDRAAAVLAERGEKAMAEFDAWLRADGHRRNPGTTADLIAAGLFVLLVEKRIECPVKFY